jgi:hypothetical protein
LYIYFHVLQIHLKYSPEEMRKQIEDYPAAESEDDAEEDAEDDAEDDSEDDSEDDPEDD